MYIQCIYIIHRTLYVYVPYFQATIDNEVRNIYKRNKRKNAFFTVHVHLQ